MINKQDLLRRIAVIAGRANDRYVVQLVNDCREALMEKDSQPVASAEYAAPTVNKAEPASQVGARPPAEFEEWPCYYCGHRNLHNGPAGSVDDACTHPCCECGFYTPDKSGAEAENDSYILRHAGIVEVAIRNQSVAEYMDQWEGRALKAEAQSVVDAARVKELKTQNERLRQAVMNQSGDNLCWISNEAEAKALPRKQFLESCERYHAQLVGTFGEATGLRTIAQLEAEIVRLQQRVVDSGQMLSKISLILDGIEPAPEHKPAPEYKPAPKKEITGCYISPKDKTLIQLWYDRHKCRGNKHYVITQTGIGETFVVKCSCGAADLDITDYDSW